MCYAEQEFVNSEDLIIPWEGIGDHWNETLPDPFLDFDPFFLCERLSPMFPDVPEIS
jgi:hypothetical protein